MPRLLMAASRGVLYLLFCWTLIPMFIAFIEFFVYLLMSDDAFNARYNPQPTVRYVPAQPQQAVTINMGSGNVADEILKLHDLRVSGAISDQEFETQKRRLLG